MTNQTNWRVYDGSDEQIAELSNAKDGFILRNCDGTQSLMLESYPVNVMGKFTHFWLIPADPLREMKVRWSQTGQPVWIRTNPFDWECAVPTSYVTTNPDWNIPNAEYAFTEFKD